MKRAGLLMLHCHDIFWFSEGLPTISGARRVFQRLSLIAGVIHCSRLLATGADIPMDRVGVHFHDTYGQARVSRVVSQITYPFSHS